MGNERAELGPVAAGVKERLGAAVLLLVLPTLAYLPTLAGGLIGDDVQISHSAHLRQADGWRICLRESYHFPFDPERNEYRPLTSLSFWAQVRHTGAWPQPMHLVNLLLHLAVVLALRGLLAELLDPRAALWAAAIFGMHPLMSEAVALVVGRADLLATLFALIGWRLHHGRAAATGWRRAARLAAVVSCLVLAVLSKESGIAVLGAMLVTDLMGVGRREEPPRVGEVARSHAPLWLLVIGLSVAIRLAFRGPVWYSETYFFVDNPLVTADFAVSWATAWWVIVKGWGLFLWPSPLSSDYSYHQIPLIQSWTDPRLWVVAAVISVVTAGSLLAWRRGWRVPAWGFAAWLCLALPTSNLVLEIGTIFGERLLYLPGGLLAAVAGSAVARLGSALPSISQGLLRVAWAVLLASLFFGTLSRSIDWMSGRRLTERQATVAPDSVRTWKHLATQRLADGDAAAALADVDRALAITGAWSDLWMLRSQALAATGQLDEAVASASRAHLLGETSPGFYLHLAGLYGALEQPDDERETLRRGLARHPGDRRLRDRWQALVEDAPGGPPAR